MEGPVTTTNKREREGEDEEEVAAAETAQVVDEPRLFLMLRDGHIVSAPRGLLLRISVTLRLLAEDANLDENGPDCALPVALDRAVWGFVEPLLELDTATRVHSALAGVELRFLMEVIRGLSYLDVSFLNQCLIDFVVENGERAVNTVPPEEVASLPEDCRLSLIMSILLKRNGPLIGDGAVKEFPQRFPFIKWGALMNEKTLVLLTAHAGPGKVRDELHVLDLRTEKTLAVRVLDEFFLSLSVSRCDEHPVIYLLSHWCLRAIDGTSFRTLYETPLENGFAVQISHDKKVLAVATSNSIVLLDPVTGNPVPGGFEYPHRDHFQGFNFRRSVPQKDYELMFSARDDHLFLVPSCGNKSSYCFCVATGEQLPDFRTPWVALIPDEPNHVLILHEGRDPSRYNLKKKKSSRWVRGSIHDRLWPKCILTSKFMVDEKGQVRSNLDGRLISSSCFDHHLHSRSVHFLESSPSLVVIVKNAGVYQMRHPYATFASLLRAKESAKIWLFLKKSFKLASQRLRNMAWKHIMQILTESDAPAIPLKRYETV